MPAVMYILCSKFSAVNRKLFTALNLQTYFDRRSLYCNYFFLPLYSSDTVNLARPLARRAAKTRRPFFVAILSRKPCLFFLFLLEGWNVLFIVLCILYCLYSLFRLFAFQLAKLLFFFILTKFWRCIFYFLFLGFLGFLSLCLAACSNIVLQLSLIGCCALECAVWPFCLCMLSFFLILFA